MISGTGFLVSKELMQENGGWAFHLLTEDIQFSVECALNRKQIGYSGPEKIKYLWISPLYIFSYVPIAICALFQKVRWDPIQHHSHAELKEVG